MLVKGVGIMTTLMRFWPSLECVAAVSTVVAQWRMLLGVEFERTKRFFRPLKEFALTYPRPDMKYFYHVEIHATDQIIGVCDETGETIKLASEDLVLYELDRVAFSRAVARALGIPGTPTPVDDLAFTEYLGYYLPVVGQRLRAYLSICCQAADFLHVVTRLAAMHNEPFLVLAPTCRYFTPAVKTVMQQSNASLIPLAEVLALDEGDQFTAMASAAAMLDEFVGKAIPDGHDVRKAESQVNEFHKVGAIWHIRFANRTVYLSETKGLEYLAHLIAHPNSQIRCATIVAAVSGNSPPMAFGSSGETLDIEALAAYKRQIAELKEELVEAQRYHDCRRQETIQAAVDQLTHEVAAALGLGGRSRLHSDINRFRKSVTMAITRAILRIGISHPLLGRHLAAAIHTGTDLSYVPDHPMEWVV
jgi:hypothetical protein